MTKQSEVKVSFARPNGEARLEWIGGLDLYADGGLIQVFVDDEFFGNYIQGEMCTKSKSTPPTILLAAEKLRNERRKLLPNEWQDVRDGKVYPGGLTIHDPTQRARVRAIVAGMQEEKADGSKNQLHTVAHGSDDSGHGESFGRGAEGERGDGTAGYGHPGGDSVSPVAGGSGATDRSAPGLPSGVTPSGEVKAPFGLEWRDDPGDSAVGIRDAVVLDVGPVFCFYTPPSKRVDITIGGTGTVEERLRVAHAALSDHIRRGDKKSTPALREAWQAFQGAADCEGASWDPDRISWVFVIYLAAACFCFGSGLGCWIGHNMAREASTETCRAIVGKSARYIEGRCYVASPDGSLVPAKGRVGQ